MKKEAGFTLIELFVASSLLLVVMAGISSFYIAHKSALIREELQRSVDINLKAGMAIITRELRNAGYCLPKGNLSAWIPWVTGFVSNPTIIEGTGSDPDTISVARCTSQPVTTLSTSSGTGTSLSLDGTTEVNNDQGRMLWIGTQEHAHVTKVEDERKVYIDTDPMTPYLQTVEMDHPAGTPVHRVDVWTYTVDTETNRLRVDRNDGRNPETLLTGIKDLQIETLSTGERYRVTLTAQSEKENPRTGEFFERRMSGIVNVRN